MKKFIAIILTLTMLVMVTSCGKKEVDCSECSGTGFQNCRCHNIAVGDAILKGNKINTTNRNDPNYPRDPNCTICDGHGYYDCATCDGTGKLPK